MLLEGAKLLKVLTVSEANKSTLAETLETPIRFSDMQMCPIFSWPPAKARREGMRVRFDGKES